MATIKKNSIQRVKASLEEYKYNIEVIEFNESTRTAEDAANTIGCEVGQIIKSLIFKGKTSGDPILVVASGVNRVNTKSLAKLIGEKLSKADADFVRKHTGFAIGGVAPIGHISKIRTLIDEDLMKEKIIWAAAGTPNSVFKLTPEILLETTQGDLTSVK